MMNLSGSSWPVEIDPIARPELERETMRDIIGIIFGAVFLFIGAWLLNNGISGRDTLQAETLIDLTLNNAMTSAKKEGVLTGGRSRAVLCVTFGSSPLS